MTDTIEKFYETNIINKDIRVIALSDIHGDIQSFIIALRDCAKVIRKKTPTEGATGLMSYEEFNQKKYDDNMERILNVNLNTDEQYIDDLNYEWCGENTHVVICGDMIDPYRSVLHSYCLKGSKACSYYPQIELKILMFINALNNQALSTGGKIIKLFGNHELGNIISHPDVGYNVTNTYPEDHVGKYYKDISRVDIFKVGNPGFILLINGGCGILIKINNTIFVHGDLVESYDKYDELNQFINNPSNTTQDQWNSKFERMMYNGSSLESRRRGDSMNASGRTVGKFKGSTGTSEKFCDNLVKSFETFKGTSSVITEDPHILQLVIGHCIQSDISKIHGVPRNEGGKFHKAGETYSDKIYEDGIIEVFSKTIYSGPPVFDKSEPRTRIFGITMECLIPGTNLNRLYRIDVGSSRGVDDYNITDDIGVRHIPGRINYPETVEDENKWLYSRTPQILELLPDSSINIVKSKINNTRRHLQRPAYELHAQQFKELNIDDPENKHYLNKYLKYKNKYLKLKYSTRW